MLVSSELRVGHAIIRRQAEKVTVSDPYTKEEFILVSEIPIKAEPALPIHVPVRLAECIYLELKDPLIVSKKTGIWVTLPYELRVAAGERTLKVLSPFKVKHTVVGTPYEGTICRWFSSTVISDPNAWSGVEALGKIVVEVTTTEVVKGIYARLNMLRLYAKEGEQLPVFYGTMRGSIRDNVIYVNNVDNEPPINGLKEVQGLIEQNTTRYFHMEFREGP